MFKYTFSMLVDQIHQAAYSELSSLLLWSSLAWLPSYGFFIGLLKVRSFY